MHDLELKFPGERVVVGECVEHADIGHQESLEKSALAFDARVTQVFNFSHVPRRARDACQFFLQCPCGQPLSEVLT